ncbi:metalloregulator ArsR/SmtB family transcription factor [Kiloniella laminariae]|uniref:Metalloregulator ArsR/SmtB family transcription factor n=1 Tax=Kiloniella laminariae TaxID=454162 RepID=A0ABT4LGX2_9PROT|nr:metalloregulator ArsR/SmtB family transcription factor [Kiloniella laminariae]MCZ4279252.1 metalloregulator ArsR/SmtB family transcription factor [Kiloniella laminariae]
MTFSALGDQRRLALVKKLYSADALSISVLCEDMDVSRQAISKHLKTLTDARLVSSERSGRETLYSLEKEKLEEANAFLALVGEKWDDALDRLKAHLASPAADQPAKATQDAGKPAEGDPALELAGQRSALAKPKEQNPIKQNPIKQNREK